MSSSPKALFLSRKCGPLLKVLKTLKFRRTQNPRNKSPRSASNYDTSRFDDSISNFNPTNQTLNTTPAALLVLLHVQPSQHQSPTMHNGVSRCSYIFLTHWLFCLCLTHVSVSRNAVLPRLPWCRSRYVANITGRAGPCRKRARALTWLEQMRSKLPASEHEKSKLHKLLKTMKLGPVCLHFQTW